MGRENACENISLIGIHKNGALQELLAVPAAPGVPRRHRRPAPRRVRRADVDRGANRRPRARSSPASGCSCSAPARSARPWRSPRSTVARRCCSSTASLRGSSAARPAPHSPSPRRRGRSLARARDWAGGELPEVVVEATGSKQAMRASLDLVAAAGRVLVVGLSSHEVPLRVGALPFRELDVLGVSTCQSVDFAAAAELVQRRRAPSCR
jgi:hypothetical protein